MDTLHDFDIVRAVSRPLQLRAVTDGEKAADDTRIGTLFGYSTVFNTWYEVSSWLEGDFLEQIAPGAASQTIREEGDQVKVLFNHGRDMQINNKVLGIHEDLREDDIGVYYQVPLLDTSYNRDLLPGLQADAYGSSFMFRVLAESWNDEPGVSDHNPKGLPERTIDRFRLFEHGPVTFPANPAATSGARCVSMTDDFYRATLAPDAYEALAARARTVRNAEPSGTKGVPGAGDEETPIDYGRDNARRLLTRTPI